MTAPVRLAVFDCDGTLVDSQHSIIASVHAACGVHGLPTPTADAVRRIVGLPLMEGIGRLWPDASVQEHTTMVGFYRHHFAELRAAGGVVEPLFPGILGALATLEATGWLLGVATGKSLKGLIASLDGHGLNGRFCTVQTADSAPGKPNPGMLLQAMAEAGAAPEATVMIGDTTFDMEMAGNAGTRAIGVAWGYHAAQELMDAGAEAVVKLCCDLPETIRAIMERRP